MGQIPLPGIHADAFRFPDHRQKRQQNAVEIGRDGPDSASQVFMRIPILVKNIAKNASKTLWK